MNTGVAFGYGRFARGLLLLLRLRLLLLVLPLARVLGLILILILVLEQYMFVLASRPNSCVIGAAIIDGDIFSKGTISGL